MSNRYPLVDDTHPIISYLRSNPECLITHTSLDNSFIDDWYVGIDVSIQVNYNVTFKVGLHINNVSFLYDLGRCVFDTNTQTTIKKRILNIVE